MRWRNFWRAIALAGFAFCAPAQVFGATPIEEVRAVSALPGLDLARLQRGEIISARGPVGHFSRGVYAEHCFFVAAPAATVAQKLAHWDPTGHRELDVAAYHEYSWPAPANAWDALTLTTKRREDRALINDTWQVPPRGLHITATEAGSLRQMMTGDRAAQATTFWRRILKARNDAIAARGIDALPPSAPNITARSEFDGVLSLGPAIATHFGFGVEKQPFPPASKAGDQIFPYWEAELMRGHTNLANGVIVLRKNAQSFQIMDCTYYASDTYFLSLNFYEIWPVENGALVWQINFAAAPFRTFTGGLDRVFAANEMIKETTQTIKAFRGDAERK